MGPTVRAEVMDEVVDLARQAGARTTPWFRSESLRVEAKADGTPVTQADREAERFLRDEIARRHPGDAVVGEEEGDREGTSGRRWIIDPIDGTKAFAHGVPLYSTLVALEDEHGPAVGVIVLPALSETVYAGRGLGCFANGQRVATGGHRELRGAWLCTSGLDNWPPSALDRARAAGCHVRTWGDGYGYALVATGRVEAMVDPTAALWDLAPMPVILAEAGGQFTDLNGARRADGGAGVASNGFLHDEVLGMLAGGGQAPLPTSPRA